MSKIETDQMGEYDVEALPEGLTFPLKINDLNGSVDDAANKTIFTWEFPNMRRNLKDLRLARRRIAFLVRSLNVLHYGVEVEGDTEIAIPGNAAPVTAGNDDNADAPSTKKRGRKPKAK